MKVSFPVFFVMWAQVKRWEVPPLHIRICEWLDDYGEFGLLMVFRGAAKSTIIAVYQAYRLYKDPTLRFLDWAADDKLATKLTRDVRDVLRRHPLTQGMLEGKPGEFAFWVAGSDDERNASVTASGILSNTVGSRADEIIHDDIEVPKNVASPDLQDKLRTNVSDGVYILVPGGKSLFIGTPHTFNSIYVDAEKDGANVLKIPLFEHNQRIIDAANVTSMTLTIPQDDLIIFHGKEALTEGFDYTVHGDELRFIRPLSGVIDAYAGCAWPERFTRDDIIKRRKRAKTLNQWDSQYMLRAKPLEDSRLNPDLLRAYDVEPVFQEANGVMRCTIGTRRIASVRVYWDVSTGSAKSDDSVLSIVFGDEIGNYYWHRSVQLLGEIEEQCAKIREVVEQFKLSSISVETNGLGTFVPSILRKALKDTGCAVLPVQAKGQKAERILAGIEPPLSGGMLWAHVSVYDTPAVEQLREFNPAQKNKKDDFADSLAGALLESPVRIGRNRSTITGTPITFGRSSQQVTAQTAFGV